MRGLALAGSLAFLVAGCSGSTSSAEVVIPGNPCAYVSASDVSAVVGGPVAQGVVASDTNPPPSMSTMSCDFQPEGSYILPAAGSNALVQHVRVAFVDDSLYVGFRTVKDPGMTIQPVTGIGDAAFVASSIHSNLLFVARGRYRLIFEVLAGLTSFAESEEKLARVVVPRLPG